MHKLTRVYVGRDQNFRSVDKKTARLNHQPAKLCIRPIAFTIFIQLSHIYSLTIVIKASKHITTDCKPQNPGSSAAPARHSEETGRAETLAQQGAEALFKLQAKPNSSDANVQSEFNGRESSVREGGEGREDGVRARFVGCPCLEQHHRTLMQPQHPDINKLQSACET